MAHRETKKHRKQRKGRGSLFRFKGNLSSSFFPSTLIHSLCATLVPWGKWELLVIGAIHLSIRELQDPMGFVLWSGNPRPRGTQDEVSTCLCLQQNHLHCLSIWVAMSSSSSSSLALLTLILYFLIQEKLISSFMIILKLLCADESLFLWGPAHLHL